VGAVPRRGWASSPLGFLRRVIIGAYEDQILFLGSALTFDALLAALPFVLLLLAALGYFVHSGADAMADILGLLDRILPEGPGGKGPLERAEELITGVVDSRAELTIYGIPLFVWFATRFFSAVRSALNEIFDTHESRSYLVGKGLDLFLVVVTLVMFTANALLTVIVADYPFIGRFVVGISTYLVGLFLFFIIYVIAPTRLMRWDTAVVAAAVASLGFEIAKKLYSLYLAEFATIDRLISNANAIALLLFVVWIYFMVCLFLLGAEVAETYDLMRRQREQQAILA
jgi:membrane protein